MRVHVLGMSPTARIVRAKLDAAGYVVSDQAPLLTIEINAQPGATLTVDGVDCRLSRLAAYRIGELAPGGLIAVKASGGNKNDRRMVVVLPAGDAATGEAVETGIVRAVDQFVAQEVTGARQASPATIAYRLDSLHGDLNALALQVQKPWWRKVFG